MGRSRSRRIRTVLLFLCVCMASAGMIGWSTGAGKNGPLESVAAASASAGAPVAKEAEELADALPLLSSLGEQAMLPGSPIRLVLKWQGEYTEGRIKASEAAAKLASGLGLGAFSSLEEDGHQTYRAAAEQGQQMRSSMFWSELGNGHSYVIVTLETTDLLQATGIQSEAVQAGVILEQSGITSEWNVSLQGLAKEQATLLQAMNKTEQLLTARLTGAAAAESYQDETTFSRSYSVPDMQRSVRSGGQRIALQAAVHRDGNTDQNRLTIGFPLITIEY